MKQSTKQKLEYSINLLKKAESLALRLQPDFGFRLAFSGGKDSQVLYHVAKMADVRFKAFFSPTTVDPPQLLRFIRTHYKDVQFEPPKQNIWQMAMQKKCAPTRFIRWCCKEFKENHGAGTVTLVGVRKQESVKRSKRKELAIFNKEITNIDFDQFSEHEEEMVSCVNGSDKITLSPLLNWTENDVWDFLNSNNIPHCELYDNGYNRIGCIMCPMSTYKQKLKEAKDFPWVLLKWLDVFDRLYKNDTTKNLTAKQRLHWWIRGKSFQEFSYAELQPKLFDCDEDELDKLIEEAYKRYPKMKNNDRNW